MRQQRSLNITLPEDTLKFFRSKVESGEYASESDVILETLEAFRSDAEEQARWEREVIVPICERMEANPSSAIPIETIRRNLQARRIQRLNVS